MNAMDNPLFSLTDETDTTDIADIADTHHSDVMDELLELRHQLLGLQKENAVLRRNLEETQALKVQLENSLLLSVPSIDVVEKKSSKAKKRDPSRESKAFSAFMMAQKTNQDVVDSVTAKMNTIGYQIKSSKKKNLVPYQIMKLECELLYEQLPSEEKQRWLDSIDK